MSGFTKNLPVAIKLGLRDLRNNKIATGILVSVLAIVIALTLPGVMIDHARPIVERVNSYTSQPQRFPAPQATDTAAPNGNTVQASLENASPSAPSAFESVGLEAIPLVHGSVSFPLLESNYAQCEGSERAQTIADFGADACVLGAAYSAADWNDQKLSEQVNLVSGRLPANATEIAFEVSAEYPVIGNDYAIGSVLEAASAQGTSPLTVVGHFSTVPWNDNALLHSDFAAPVDGSTSTELLGFGPELSSEQAISLATQFMDVENSEQPYWFSSTVTKFYTDHDTLTRAATKIPLDEIETYSSNNGTFSSLILVGLLTLVTLISVPLYWQSHKRRAAQFELLDRTGLSSGRLVLSRMLPALVTGLLAAVGGLLLVWSGLFNFMFINYWGMEVAVGNVYSFSYSAGVALLAGMVPVAIASVLPVLTERLSSTRVPAQAASKREATSRTKSALFGGVAVLCGLLLAFGSAQFSSAGSVSGFSPITGMVAGLVVVIVGAYFVAAALLSTISRRSSEWPLVRRLAAQELARSMGATVNLVIPLAILTGIGCASTVIGRQHDFEYIDRNYLELFSVVAMILCLLIILVLMFSVRRTPEELASSRSSLTTQGVFDSEISAINGWRCFILATVSCLTGYILGTVIGAILMIYRAHTDGMPFIPQSMLPDLTTIIVVVLPISLAYLIGKLSGGKPPQLTPATVTA